MEAEPPDPSKPAVDRRRVRYRAAEEQVHEAMKLMDDSPGDREIVVLLEMALTKLAARGVRPKF